MIEAACRMDRAASGPALYYRCVRDQIAALKKDSGPPDLQLLSVDELGIVKSACELDRSVSGPSKYYACLRNQFEAVRTGAGLPHLNSVTPDERSMIESACNSTDLSVAPQSTTACGVNIQHFERAWPTRHEHRHAGRTGMIESACRVHKSVSGPATTPAFEVSWQPWAATRQRRGQMLRERQVRARQVETCQRSRAPFHLSHVGQLQMAHPQAVTGQLG